MRRKVSRIAFALLLVGIICAAGATLLAKPGGGKGGFMACPVPPCLRPCAFPAEPEVLCKTGDGGTIKTSFACCCCGGAGNFFKPLK